MTTPNPLCSCDLGHAWCPHCSLLYSVPKFEQLGVVEWDCVECGKPLVGVGHRMWLRIVAKQGETARANIEVRNAALKESRRNAAT